jgi:hypothetical protein
MTGGRLVVDLIMVDLIMVDLIMVDLIMVDLIMVDLIMVDLIMVDLIMVDLMRLTMIDHAPRKDTLWTVDVNRPPHDRSHEIGQPLLSRACSREGGRGALGRGFETACNPQEIATSRSIS